MTIGGLVTNVALSYSSSSKPSIKTSSAVLSSLSSNSTPMSAAITAAVSKSTESLMVFKIPSLNKRLVISAAVIPIYSLKTLSGIISVVITARSIFMVLTSACALTFLAGRSFL